MNLYAREDDCLDKNINGYAIFCNVYCRVNIGPQKVILKKISPKLAHLASSKIENLRIMILLGTNKQIR